MQLSDKLCLRFGPRSTWSIKGKGQKEREREKNVSDKLMQWEEKVKKACWEIKKQTKSVRSCLLLLQQSLINSGFISSMVDNRVNVGTVDSSMRGWCRRWLIGQRGG